MDAASNTSAPLRPATGWVLSRSEWPVTVLAALACVVLTIVLAAGHVAGQGVGALAAATFVVTVAWCLTERRAARTLVVFGLYIGLLDGYLKLRTGNRELTLARDVLLWAIAAGVLWRSVRAGETLRLPPLAGFVIAFALATLVQLANPAAPDAFQSLAGVRQHLEFVPLFFLGYALVRTPSRLRGLLVILVVIAAANGAVSYVQSTLTPAELAGWGTGYSERIYGTGIFVGQGKVAADIVDGNAVSVHVRPFGLGSEIGAGAVAAAIALPALIALLMLGSAQLRLLALVCAPAVAVGIVTSGSRAALVACVASVLAYLCLAGATRSMLRAATAAAVIAVLVVLTFAQLGSGNDTARRAQTIAPTKVFDTYWNERGVSVRKVGDYLVDHPLGLGVGTVGPAAHVLSGGRVALDAETQWNLIVLETGIVGLVILLLLGGRLIVLSVRHIRPCPEPGLRLALAAVAAPLASIVVLCFAGPVTVSAPTAPFLWLTAGVLSYWLLGPGARTVRPGSPPASRV